MARPENIDCAGEESHARVTVVIVDLARDVVGEVAPEQLDYLELVTAAWENGKAPRKRPWAWSAASSVGSGVEPAMLAADLICQLLTGTIAQVLGSAAFAGLQRRRWWRRSLRVARPVQVTLDAGQIDEVRDACVTHGMTLGLSETEATMLADAVHGTLRRAADDGQG